MMTSILTVKGYLPITIGTMAELSRKSITDAVVDYFREKIQSGELGPGDKLPSERSLMQQLGVSRFSLREGLARLSALGIITIRQGKGAFICEDVKAQTLRDVLLPLLSNTNAHRFNELIEARILLETALAQKAALIRREEDLVKLRKNLEATAAALDDAERFAVLDFEFHQIIARIAKNEFLFRMQEVLHGAVEEFIHENVRQASSRHDALADHRLIVAAVEKQSPEEVELQMRKHIHVCVKHYQDLRG